MVESLEYKLKSIMASFSNIPVPSSGGTPSSPGSGSTTSGANTKPQQPVSRVPRRPGLGAAIAGSSASASIPAASANTNPAPTPPAQNAAPIPSPFTAAPAPQPVMPPRPANAAAPTPPTAPRQTPPIPQFPNQPAPAATRQANTPQPTARLAPAQTPPPPTPTPNVNPNVAAGPTPPIQHQAANPANGLGWNMLKAAMLLPFQIFNSPWVVKVDANKKAVCLLNGMFHEVLEPGIYFRPRIRKLGFAVKPQESITPASRSIDIPEVNIKGIDTPLKHVVFNFQIGPTNDNFKDFVLAKNWAIVDSAFQKSFQRNLKTIIAGLQPDADGNYRYNELLEALRSPTTDDAARRLEAFDAQVMQEVNAEIKHRGFGFTITSFVVGKLEEPQEMRDAEKEKQRAITGQQTAKAQAEQTRITAEGEAQAIQLRTTALAEGQAKFNEASVAGLDPNTPANIRAQVLIAQTQASKAAEAAANLKSPGVINMGSSNGGGAGLQDLVGLNAAFQLSQTTPAANTAGPAQQPVAPSPNVPRPAPSNARVSTPTQPGQPGATPQVPPAAKP
jgi:regulator of protease activity HflC (stomatin/prohibitin superfamily)